MASGMVVFIGFVVILLAVIIVALLRPAPMVRAERRRQREWDDWAKTKEPSR